FDPSLHEAVQDTSTGDEKVLGTVLRQGFRIGDRTLRTAMVIIADPQ
ncbi:nucleotide exchange factor GrpE, partial [Corynebacterium variabile]